MRVVKRLYSKDAQSALLSRAFDDVIRSTSVPVPFSYLEFNIGYPRSEIDGERAAFGVSLDDPMLAGTDSRAAGALVRFELYRLFVRNIITRKLPPMIEDVLVSREMMRHGYSEDLVYLFYLFMARHKVKDCRSFLKMNMPWIAFHGRDGFYESLFAELAGRIKRPKYEKETKLLVKALCKDLMDFENLKEALELYEKTVYG